MKILMCVYVKIQVYNFRVVDIKKILKIESIKHKESSMKLSINRNSLHVTFSKDQFIINTKYL